MGNWFRGLLRVIDTVTSAGALALGRAIKIALAIAIGWPIVMMVCAMAVPHRNALVVMPIVALVPLVALLEITLRMDSRILGFGTVGIALVAHARKAEARKAINVLRGILTFEMLLGVYLAWVPIEPRYVALLTLIFFIAALTTHKAIRWGAVLAIAYFTFIFAKDAYAKTTIENLPQGYSVLTCGNTEPTYLQLPATITLAAGCIHGPIYLPPHTWIQSTLGGPDDWIAVKGKDGEVSKVIRWEPHQDGNLGGILKGEQKIGIEGQGTLTITEDFTESTK